MSQRPQVRIWGIVDLFLLLAIVLMIARVDAVAEAESESDTVATLEAEKKELLAHLGEANAKNGRLSRALMDASAAEVAAGEARAKVEAEQEKAQDHQRELERALANFKEAVDENFAQEEDIERYRRLRGMVDIIEVTLNDASLVAIDRQTFNKSEFVLSWQGKDPLLPTLAQRIDQEKLKLAMLTLKQHILSQERGRVLIMLGYRESNGILRESFRAAALAMAKELAEVGGAPEITVSQWFTREIK